MARTPDNKPKKGGSTTKMAATARAMKMPAGRASRIDRSLLPKSEKPVQSTPTPGAAARFAAINRALGR